MKHVCVVVSLTILKDYTSHSKKNIMVSLQFCLYKDNFFQNFLLYCVEHFRRYIQTFTNHHMQRSKTLRKPHSKLMDVFLTCHHASWVPNKFISRSPCYFSLLHKLIECKLPRFSNIYHHRKLQDSTLHDMQCCLRMKTDIFELQFKKPK